jgi:endonuclease YncB( thermonuclease family)
MSKATIKTIFILFALCLSAAAQPQPIIGKVVGVSDGDTITVLDDQKRQYKIRLEGIDAPESNQDFGSKAKQSLPCSPKAHYLTSAICDGKFDAVLARAN